MEPVRKESCQAGKTEATVLHHCRGKSVVRESVRVRSQEKLTAEEVCKIGHLEVKLVLLVRESLRANLGDVCAGGVSDLARGCSDPRQHVLVATEQPLTVTFALGIGLLRQAHEQLRVRIALVEEVLHLAHAAQLRVKLLQVDVVRLRRDVRGKLRQTIALVER